MGARILEPAGAGDRATAYIADGEWLVRVARDEEGERALRREAALTPTLAPALPVPVPVVERTGTIDGCLWVLHRYLPGTPADPSATSELWASQLGAFLEALQAFDPDRASGLVLRDRSDGYRWELDRARAELFEHLDADVRRTLEGGVRGLVDDPIDDRAVVVHGDLRPRHLLLDEAGSALVAVLDLGDARLGDPDYDLGFVVTYFGWPFAEQVLGHVEPDRRRRRLRRGAFLHAWDGIRWATSCAGREGREAELRSALSLVTAQIRELDEYANG